jgi:SAM-dependent methyltransferase
MSNKQFENVNWRILRTAINHRLVFLYPSGYWTRRLEGAKELWSKQFTTECPNASHIYEAAQPGPWQRVLEFGANSGGNLTYFLDRHAGLEAVGVDINPIVKRPELQYPGYHGVIGDETVLGTFAPDSFDLAFTVSVLDHIPAPHVAQQTLKTLITLGRKVVLLEPMIPGVHGDVSGRVRSEVAPGLPAPHKRFASHCYLWNYNKWLSRLPVTWTCRADPLHSHSLGPFYHLYVITRR